MGSDHFPIRVGVNDRHVCDMTRVDKWKLQTADWTVFVRECEKQANLHSLFDEDVDRFCAKVTDAIVRTTRTLASRTEDQVSSVLDLYDIKSAVYERNRALNQWRRTRLLDDGVSYRRLKAAAQTLICDAAMQHRKEYCATLSGRIKVTTV
jgi:hypothetical protein